MPLINSDQPIEFLGKLYDRVNLKTFSLYELKTLHNLLWDNLSNEHVDMPIKRRRKWKSEEEAVELTWKILGVYNGDIEMADTKPKTEKPTPGCYSTELVKRPSRRMFGRIKKVGTPDKSQRPFAWKDFKDGQRLIDIKENPKLHAGKISFWMRQKPPLIKLEDITDAQFEKELNTWYKSHGLTNPTAAKQEAAKKRSADKVVRDKDRAAKAKVKATEKAAKVTAAAKKKAATAKAKPKAVKAKATPAKAKAKAA